MLEPIAQASLWLSLTSVSWWWVVTGDTYGKSWFQTFQHQLMPWVSGRRQDMVKATSVTWSTSTAPPPTGSWTSETIFSSSRTRASELLTAKSALACVQVPMGAIFWEDMDFGHLQVTMRALDMCPYFDFHNMRWDLTLVLWTNQNVFWTQTFSYCLITLAAYKPLCCVLSLPDSWMRLEDIFSFLSWADLEYIVESEAIYMYLHELWPVLVIFALSSCPYVSDSAKYIYAWIL